MKVSIEWEYDHTADGNLTTCGSIVIEHFEQDPDPLNRSKQKITFCGKVDRINQSDREYGQDFLKNAIMEKMKDLALQVSAAVAGESC